MSKQKKNRTMDKFPLVISVGSIMLLLGVCIAEKNVYEIDHRIDPSIRIDGKDTTFIYKMNEHQ